MSKRPPPVTICMTSLLAQPVYGIIPKENTSQSNTPNDLQIYINVNIYGLCINIRFGVDRCLPNVRFRRENSVQKRFRRHPLYRQHRFPALSVIIRSVNVSGHSEVGYFDHSSRPFRCQQAISGSNVSAIQVKFSKDTSCDIFVLINTCE